MKTVIFATLCACALAVGAAPQGKIINGGEVVPYSLPFIVSIQVKTGNTFTHSCAGSILDESTILTAASCVDGQSERNLQVVAAEHSLGTVSGEEEIRSVLSFVTDAAYNPDTNEKDIAIIKLTTPLVYTSKVAPVVLPGPVSELDPPAGLDVTIAGWGDTVQVNGTGSDVLIGATVPVVADDACNLAYGGNENVTVVLPSMMCTGGGSADACNRDMGGPLYTGVGTEAVIHGIISWGIGCGENYPDVYTQVSYFLDWIAANRG